MNVLMMPFFPRRAGGKGRILSLPHHLQLWSEQKCSRCYRRTFVAVDQTLSLPLLAPSPSSFRKKSTSSSQNVAVSGFEAAGQRNKVVSFPQQQRWAQQQRALWKPMPSSTSFSSIGTTTMTTTMTRRMFGSDMSTDSIMELFRSSLKEKERKKPTESNDGNKGKRKKRGAKEKKSELEAPTTTKEAPHTSPAIDFFGLTEEIKDHQQEPSPEKKEQQQPADRLSEEKDYIRKSTFGKSKERKLSTDNLFAGESYNTASPSKLSLDSLFGESPKDKRESKVDGTKLHSIDSIFGGELSRTKEEDVKPNDKNESQVEGTKLSIDSIFGGELSRGKEKDTKPDDETESQVEGMKLSIESIFGGQFSRIEQKDTKPKNKTETFSPSSESKINIRPWMKVNTELDDSLMEIFKLSEEAFKEDVRSENAFELRAWEEYISLLEGKVMTGKSYERNKVKLSKEQLNTVEAWLRREEPLDNFAIELPTFARELENLSNMKGEVLTSVSSQSTFLEDVKQQKKRFLDHTGCNLKQYKFLQGAMRGLVMLSASSAMGAAPLVIWHKLKEMGLADGETLQIFLYVATTFYHSRSQNFLHTNTDLSPLASVKDLFQMSDGSQDDNSLSDNEGGNETGAGTADLPEEVAIYRDLLYKATSQSITIRLRRLVAQGRAVEAETMLFNSEKLADTQFHLRSFTPILRLYLNQGEMGKALAFYKRMRTYPNVIFDADTYSALISSMAAQGCFQPGAPRPSAEGSDKNASGSDETQHPIEQGTASGPGLLDELMTEMGEALLDIPIASAKRLYDGFAKGYPDSDLEVTSSLAPLQIVNGPLSSSPNKVVLNRVRIDPMKGFCSRSGAKLRLIQLTEAEREQMRDGIFQLAVESENAHFARQKESGGRNNRTRSHANIILKDFSEWLDGRQGDPFTAIIDAPNVAYYMQNFEEGRFSYFQVQYLVESLEKLGERPLIILPHKFMYNNRFQISIGSAKFGFGPTNFQVVTDEEHEVREEWQRSGKVFVVPPAVLDDFFWIFGSVSDQLNSRKGRDLTVYPMETDNSHDNSGRWAGARPSLISNDKMRDHKLMLLKPRLFLRWNTAHLVNFHFNAFAGSHKNITEDAVFTVPCAFSREIQRNLTDAGMVWHIPVADTEDEWICIRVPR